MHTIMILRALPAAGKSTFARSLLVKEPNRWKRINRDDIRAMLDVGPWSTESEQFVVSLQRHAITSAFKAGYDVIVDDTNIVVSTVNKLHQLAESVGDVKVIEKVFNVSVEECLRRNALREGRARVPDSVIIGMARKAGLDRGVILNDKETYYPGKSADVVEQDASLPKAIMCDLDGTLAIIGDRSPYDATDCDIKDNPNWAVINCVLAMYRIGTEIIFMSGRDQKYRSETERFIEEYCRIAIREPIKYALHMRGETAPDLNKEDFRKDAVVKRELFDKYVRGKYNVLFVLDDRNQVVDFWRSIGLTCFQVNYGDF